MSLLMGHTLHKCKYTAHKIHTKNIKNWVYSPHLQSSCMCECILFGHCCERHKYFLECSIETRKASFLLKKLFVPLKQLFIMYTSYLCAVMWQSLNTLSIFMHCPPLQSLVHTKRGSNSSTLGQHLQVACQTVQAATTESTHVKSPLIRFLS